ncbi:MAG: hypothetical protein WD030_02690 [Pirellulales bacterium]
MPDASFIRTILILAMSLPAVTLLACWGDSADRLAQMHPSVLAAMQLLVSLTAMMVVEGETRTVAGASSPGEL